MIRTFSGSIFVLFALLGGCAQSITDIDRTDPNKVHKSMFEGTWYVRSTITEVAPDASGAFEGIASEMKKIRWEITESSLRGWTTDSTVIGMDQEIDDCRRTGVVHVDGRIEINEELDEDCMRRTALDGPQLNQDGYRTRWGRLPEAYKGSLAVEFPISSHFDVKRSYNSATGEQSNVLTENRSDRYWWERDYIRVSWGSPTVDMLGLGSGTYGDDADPVDSDHRIRFLDASGEPVVNGMADREAGQEVTYFDFGLRQTVQGTFNYGGSTYPACWMDPALSCDAAKVFARMSFLKTEPVRDFAPIPFDDDKMGRFGYFRVERYSHMRRRGLTESGRVRMASVHDIWAKTYEREADGSFKLEPVTDDEGRTVAYRRVEIPIRDREAKPIAYHLSPYFPAAIKEYAYRVGDSWNDAYRRVVAAAWGYQSAAEADADGSEVPDMFVVCDNPVPETVPPRYRGGLGDRYFEICGKAGTRALPGDLRYNTMYWVNDPNAGPLGYGPSYQDPETGETISGTAWVYGAAIDTYAQYALDLVNAINGELPLEEIASGAYIQRMVNGHRHVSDPRRQTLEDFENLLGGDDSPLGPRGRDTMALIDRISENPIAELGNDISRARVRKLQRFLSESPMADELINGEVIAAVAKGRLAPGDAISDELRGDALDLIGGAPDAINDRKHLNDVASRLSLWTRENFEDASLIGLAREMAARYADQPQAQDAMYQELRGRIFQAVMEHEVGHTLGLRHNFAGSYDAMNFHDDFWSVRKAGLKQAWANVRDGSGITINDLMSFSELTGDELEGNGARSGYQGGVQEYQYSSIMDYGAGFNADLHGIGRYDEAALLFAYAGKVEVFDQISTNNKYLLKGSAETVLSSHSWSIGTGSYTCLPSFEDRISPAEDALTEKIHYSWLPVLFSDAPAPSGNIPAAVDAAIEAGLEKMGSGNRRLVDYSELEPLLKAERRHRFENPTDCGQSAAALHEDRPVMVPYMFCSDEWVGSLYNCNRWDEGADPASILRRAMDQWEDYYWFTNFKRDRVGFSTFAPANRALSRTYPMMLLMYQQWLFSRYQMDLINEYPWRLAVFDAVNRLGEVLARPRYGTYYLSSDGENAYLYDDDPRELGSVLDQVNNLPITADFYVPRGPGRRAYSRFDYDDGYYYYQRPLEAGHFWDFYAGLLSQGNASATMLGTESSADQQRFYLPFHLVFPAPLDRLYSGIVTNRQRDYAPKLFVRDLGGDEAACQRAAARIGAIGSNGTDKNDNGVDDCYLTVNKPLIDWRGVTMGARVGGERNGAAPFATDDTDGMDWEDGITLRIHNNYTTKLYAALLGSAFFTSSWERDFIEGLRVWRAGSSEDVDVAGDHDTISFTDPRSGFVYSASSDAARPCAVVEEERDNAMAARFVCDGQVAARRYIETTDLLERAVDTIERDGLDCSADGVPDACTADNREAALRTRDACELKLCAEDYQRRDEGDLTDAVSWSMRLRYLYQSFGSGDL